MPRNNRNKKVKKRPTHAMALRAKHRRSRRLDYANGVDLEWVLPGELDRLSLLGSAPAGRAVANLAAVSDDVVHERRHMSEEQRNRLGKDYVPMISPVKASAPGVVRVGSESEPEEEE